MTLDESGALFASELLALLKRIERTRHRSWNWWRNRGPSISLACDEGSVLHCLLCYWTDQLLFTQIRLRTIHAKAGQNR
jgi:hypothetical protein